MLCDSLYNCILNDIYDVLFYLENAIKIGVLYALIVFAVYFLYFKKKKSAFSEKNMFNHKFMWHFIGSTLFVMYMFVSCNIVYFSREPGSRVGIDMGLFSTWGVTSQAHAYVIENVILFIPFGLLFPACLSKKMSFLTIFAGALCSVCIEYIQYRTGCGYCQIDDIITNTVGAAIGYLIQFSFVGIAQKVKTNTGK